MAISFRTKIAYLAVMRIAALFCFLSFCGPALAADAVPAPVYFPILPLDAPSDTLPQLVPLAANRAIDGPHAGINRLIIALHDQGRDAVGAVSTLTALAGGMNDATLIVAPQFLLPSDIERFSAHLPDKGRDFASWQLSGWPQGEDSVTVPGHKGVSSFTVIDLLLMYLSDRRAFPDLDTIVIAGTGAGADFIQRYAAFTPAADILDRQNIRLRFVVAGASSYLYLTANRPLGGRKGFGPYDAKTCPDANVYPYGLDKLNSYARHQGVNAAKTNYALRFITYVTAAGADLVPDASCAAMTQGPNNTARAASFDLYLQSLYGEVAAKTQTFSVNPNAKPDPVGLLGSSCAMTILFGDGLCTRGLESSP